MNHERIRYLKQEHWNQRAELLGPAEKRVGTHYFGTRELSWMHSMRDLDIDEQESSGARIRWMWIRHVVGDSTKDIGDLFDGACCFSEVSSTLSCATTTTTEHVPSASIVDNTTPKTRIYISLP